MPNYRPSGSMCQACQNNTHDCSGLPFNLMQKMKTDKDGTVVVKCSMFLPSQASKK